MSEEFIEIKISEVPYYLRKGDFYRTLINNNDNDNNDTITIPKKHYKYSPFVESIEDLIHLLHTLRFWMIDYDDIPYEVIFDFIKGSKLDSCYGNKFKKIFFDFLFIYEIKALIMKLNKVKNGWNNIANYSAKRGYFLLLKYCFSKFDPLMLKNNIWKTQICTASAIGGQLKCLQYAHENGCNWNINTTLNASKYGHVNCLQYAHENGCPINENVFLIALEYFQLESLKYCIKVKCYINSQNIKIEEFKDKKCADCVKYLLENGYMINMSITNVIRCNNIDVLKYLVQKGHMKDEYYSSLIVKAINYGSYECLKFLLFAGVSHYNLENYRLSTDVEFEDNQKILKCLYYIYKKNFCPNFIENNENFYIHNAFKNPLFLWVYKSFVTKFNSVMNKLKSMIQKDIENKKGK